MTHETDSEKLRRLSQPIVDWLYEIGTPHSTVIITQADAELVDGRVATTFALRDALLDGAKTDDPAAIIAALRIEVLPKIGPAASTERTTGGDQ